jgi:hypothetical protein
MVAEGRPYNNSSYPPSPVILHHNENLAEYLAHLTFRRSWVVLLEKPEMKCNWTVHLWMKSSVRNKLRLGWQNALEMKALSIMLEIILNFPDITFTFWNVTFLICLTVNRVKLISHTSSSKKTYYCFLPTGHTVGSNSERGSVFWRSSLIAFKAHHTALKSAGGNKMLQSSADSCHLNSIMLSALI